MTPEPANVPRPGKEKEKHSKKIVDLSLDDDEVDDFEESDLFDPEGILRGGQMPAAGLQGQEMVSFEEMMLKSMLSAPPDADLEAEMERLFMEALQQGMPGQSGSFRDRMMGRVMASAMGMSRPGKKKGRIRGLLGRIFEKIFGVITQAGMPRELRGPPAKKKKPKK